MTPLGTRHTRRRYHKPLKSLLLLGLWRVLDRAGEIFDPPDDLTVEGIGRGQEGACGRSSATDGSVPPPIGPGEALRLEQLDRLAPLPIQFRHEPPPVLRGARLTLLA